MNKPIARIGVDETFGNQTRNQTEKINLRLQSDQEDPDVMELKKKFKTLFHEKKTVKGMEV